MMKGILFKEKHLKILLALRDTTQGWYIATLAKASDTTYVHTCNFLNECERLGITENEKHGKIKRITLTETGIKLADMLSNAYAIIKAGKEHEAQPKPQELQKEKT